MLGEFTVVYVVLGLSLIQQRRNFWRRPIGHPCVIPMVYNVVKFSDAVPCANKMTSHTVLCTELIIWYAAYSRFENNGWVSWNDQIMSGEDGDISKFMCLHKELSLVLRITMPSVSFLKLGIFYTAAEFLTTFSQRTRTRNAFSIVKSS